MRRILVLGLLLFAATVVARPTKLVIFTEHFPPYNFAQNGRITGINVEIVRRLCVESMLDCEFVLLPWKRAYQRALSSANTGLLTTSRNADREKLFKWVGPLVNSTTYLYKLASRTDINITDVEQAKQYIVGVQRNDVYADYFNQYGFDNTTNLLEFSYKNQELQLFFAGKIDLIVASELTLPYQLRQLAGIQEQVEPVLKLPRGMLKGNFLALNLDVDDDTRTQLQQALDQLVEADKLTPIIDLFRP